MPQVSIIIPNYNHAKFIEKRFNSVINQSFQDFEIILLDDASTDKSVEILDKLSNHSKVSHFIINNKNSGSPFKQWENGINLAQGELIWVAESDDWADSNFLATLVPAFSDPSIALAYCALYNIDENDNIIDIYYLRNSSSTIHWANDYINSGNDEIRNFLAYRNTIPNASSVVFRKSRYMEVGRINKNMQYSGDWLLWCRMIKDKKLFYTNEPLSYFRNHQASTRQAKTFDEEIQRLNENTFIIQTITREFNINISFSNCLRWQWIFNSTIKNNKIKNRELIKILPNIKIPIFRIVFCLKLMFNLYKREMLGSAHT